MSLPVRAFPKPLVDRMVGAMRRHRSYHSHPNFWCDLVDQQQNGESMFWGEYVNVGQALILAEMEKLTHRHRGRLWLHTEPGWSYAFDLKWYEEHRVEDPELEPPVREADEMDDLVQAFWGEVLSRASDTDLDAAARRG